MLSVSEMITGDKRVAGVSINTGFDLMSAGMHPKAVHTAGSEYDSGKEESIVIRKGLKKTVSLLLAASMVFSMAGCGGDGGQSTEAGIGNKDNTGTSTDQENQGPDGNADHDGTSAMGRYVEEHIDLSDQISSQSLDLSRREDGSLVILSNSSMFVSKDQGTTWNEETPDWLTAILQEGTYICSMTMGPDGTVAMLWGESVGDDWMQYLKLILPDGTQVPVETELTEEEGYFRQAVVREDGSIFASTNRGVHEVQRDGSSKAILSLDYNPSWIWVKDNLLFIDNDWGDETMPVVYDLEAEDFIEDEVLTDFVADNYDSRNMNGTDWCDMYLLPGEDGTVYIAGKKGIHRHVVGGNMIEQIVDGNLSMLSNPDYAPADMIQLEGDVFLVLFAGGKLIKFTYDPDVPTVPEKMITVYSLREDNNIRQAVSFYQTQHSDVFVSYQIGMDSGDSVTREDALKKLNTEIMAGEGPDLIVMDDMPLDSYASKGLLMDLTDYLAEYSKKEPLFDNVIDALKKDGKAYVAPATIAVPGLASGAEGMENVHDLADLAGVVEQQREKYPEKDIIGISGARGILKRFAATSEPKWITAERAVDKGVIGEYLELCKRIFDAQMDGLDEDVIEYYNVRNERMAEYYGVAQDAIDWEIFLDVMSYIGGEQRMITGWDDSQYSYLQVNSINRNKGFESTKLIAMEGQCTHVFKPVTMMAVSAASKQPDLAMGFLDTFLSAQVQGMYDGLPLNQKGFDIQFTPDKDILGQGGEPDDYGSVYTTDGEGFALGFTFYWPSDEMIASFKAELAALNTAYIPDQMLEKAVFDQGVSYMQDEKSLDEALNEIEKAVSIYMAE